MIRLFVAVDMPQEVRRLLQGMGAAIPGARLVPEDQLHLTLKFIGEVESSMLIDIKEALAEIASPAFELRLSGVGHFPPRRTPKVLWVGITPIDEILTLRNKVEKVLSDCGIPRERRKFSPHVTIARLKNSPLTRVSQFLAGNSLFETPPFQVTEFTLYSSTISQRGAIHTIQQAYPLGSPP